MCKSLHVSGQLHMYVCACGETKLVSGTSLSGSSTFAIESGALNLTLSLQMWLSSLSSMHWDSLTLLPKSRIIVDLACTLPII